MAESLSLRLFQAARGYQARLAETLSRRLAEAHGWRIPPGQLAFLGALICGVNSPSDIARSLGISRQAAQKQARELAEAGYLSICRDPERGNRTVIAFTETGARLMADCRAELAAMDADLPGDAPLLRDAADALSAAFPKAR
ncbi:MAG: MarR family transcriptional regulator [Deinococcus-Thermus bacterium]|jgi:DNA-binding MarR family transcriptional regulator|nr:MarR family transcriptional regulator [Deinococcota bacterium]